MSTDLLKPKTKFPPSKPLFAPEWLVLGVNNACNLHCKMCDVGLGNFDTTFAQNLVGTRPMNMPLDLIKKIIDGAVTHYPTIKIGYAFTEPLMYPYLGQSLQYAKSRELFTAVTTNALNLKRRTPELLEGRLDELFISLDGLESTHNYIRGNENSFRKAVEGIEELSKYDNAPDISVFCVITEWNYAELKAFADFFKRYPLKHLGFMHPNYTPQHIADAHNQKFGRLYPATDSNLGEINLENIDLGKLLEEISSINSANYPFKVSFSPEINTKDGLAIFYYEPQEFIGNQCNDVRRNIMIKSDGSVIPAHGRCYQLSVGNVYEQNLEDIWNSPVISKLGKDLYKAGGLFPACSRCCSSFGT